MSAMNLNSVKIGADGTIPAGTIFPVQLIHAMIANGVFVFAAVIAILALMGFGTDTTPDDGDFSLVGIFTFVTMALAVVVYTLAFLLARMLHGPHRLFAALETENRSELLTRSLRLIIHAGLLQVMFIESAAMMGLVTILLALINGVLAVEPAYLLNGLTSLVFLAYAVTNFPTRARLARRATALLAEAQSKTRHYETP